MSRRLKFCHRYDCVSKGKFTKVHGRGAWERVPKSYRVKDGKREYITREGFLDNVWLGRAKSEQLE